MQIGVIVISLAEDRKFYQQYKCEILTSNQINKLLINDFKADDLGRSLEEYLKANAWSEDSDGETKVYLIKDIDNKVALYFSLKCGLLYEPYDYFRLASDELDFVNMLIDALKIKDHEAINSYIESGYFDAEKTDKLYKIAQERIDIKNEGIELGDDESTLKVHKCYSAIELRHFCKNVNYQTEKRKVPLGVGLFWEVIVPQIYRITDLVGCKYLYLFAADNTPTKENQHETRKLVQYYKNDLKFEDIQGLTVIKPTYDRSCWGMIQKISDLRKNQEVIWEEFSDV